MFPLLNYQVHGKLRIVVCVEHVPEPHQPVGLSRNPSHGDHIIRCFAAHAARKPFLESVPGARSDCDAELRRLDVVRVRAEPLFRCVVGKVSDDDHGDFREIQRALLRGLGYPADGRALGAGLGQHTIQLVVHDRAWRNGFARERFRDTNVGPARAVEIRLVRREPEDRRHVGGEPRHVHPAFRTPPHDAGNSAEIAALRCRARRRSEHQESEDLPHGVGSYVRVTAEAV